MTACKNGRVESAANVVGDPITQVVRSRPTPMRKVEAKAIYSPVRPTLIADMLAQSADDRQTDHRVGEIMRS